MIHFVPALTVDISKLLLPETTNLQLTFPSSLLRKQYLFKHRSINGYFLSELLTPVHNCSSLLPERNFLGAVPFVRQTSLAVANTGNVMDHSGRAVAVTAERGGMRKDC